MFAYGLALLYVGVVCSVFEFKVLHMRDQIEIGLDVVTQFTQKRALMVVGDKGQGLAAMQRRMVADGTNRFSAPVELTKMHHVGFIDFSKFGRLTMVEINAAVDWCKQILHQNENYSNLTHVIKETHISHHQAITKQLQSQAWSSQWHPCLPARVCLVVYAARCVELRTSWWTTEWNARPAAFHLTSAACTGTGACWVCSINLKDFKTNPLTWNAYVTSTIP